MKNNSNSPKPPRVARTRWVNIFKLFLAVILIFVLLLNTSVDEFVRVFRGISPGWLLLAMFLFALTSMAKAFQYHLLVDDKLPYGSVLNVILIQNVVTNLLAAGAGIASFFTLLTTEHEIKASRALAMFLLVKLGDMIQIFLFLLIASWAVWDLIVPLHFLLIVLLAGIMLGVGGFFVIVFLRQRFFSAFRTLLVNLNIVRFSLIARLLDALESLVVSDSHFLNRSLRRAIIGSFVYMLATIAWSLATARAMNFPVGAVAVLFVILMQQILSLLPIQIMGGLGVNDLSAVYLYSFFGYGSAVFIPLMLGTRLLFYLWNAIILVYLVVSGAWKKPDKQQPEQNSSTR
ncbi:MAG: flippase-like domain-containing protein [Chloroflexi bacterium]|nr:flippase-like domain-containing protein [Chloroflexota bacterium]